MRIVHLVNYIQPQLGYQEYFLAREHARMGNTVTVVASDRYYPFPDYRSTAYPILGKRKVGAGEWCSDGFKIIRLKALFELGTKTWLLGLRKTIQRLQPDLLINHGMADFNALRVAALKRRCGFRLIYDDHTLRSERKLGLARSFFYLLYPFRYIARHADRLIGVSPECVDVAVELYGFPRSRVELIPLGADAELFRFDPELRRAFRTAHGIADDEVVIVYTGKLTASKGPHLIARAVRSLRAKLTRKLILLFVGNLDEAYRDAFECETASMPDSVRVLLMPAVPNPELVTVYSGSDIAVWPRLASISTIEAASCARPIICCDFLTERYKNGNGIPVKEDDTDDLAQAILRLVNDEELRRTMGQRGRELVERELSWKVIARRFLE